jgi:hypothetical protein
MSRFTEHTLPDGTKTIYHIKSHRCACKGTGLVPPSKDRIKNEPQAYCPKHPRQRFWLQTQKDGTTKLIKVGRP